MILFIKFILHKEHDTRAHKGIKKGAIKKVDSKTPENMARLTAEERELLVWCNWVRVMPILQES